MSVTVSSARAARVAEAAADPSAAARFSLPGVIAGARMLRSADVGGVGAIWGEVCKECDVEVQNYLGSGRDKMLRLKLGISDPVDAHR